jgi:nucleotide-binding universal stress UspA family protein
MFQRILVPLDGSLLAERALPIAAHIARASGGAIVLLRVVEPPVAYETYTLVQKSGAEDIAETITDYTDEAADYLHSLVHAEVLQDIPVTTAEVVGSADQAILDYITASRPDLIVICSHGYSGFKRWALGSVAEKVIHHAEIPVLLVRLNGPTLYDPEREHPLRILATVDGSAMSEAVLGPVTQLMEALAPPSQCQLHLLQVVDTTSISRNRGYKENVEAEEIEQVKQQAMAYLARIADRVRSLTPVEYKFSITYSVNTAQDIATAIISSAERLEGTENILTTEGYDLIAMATHGRSAMTRWLMGSVTGRALHGTRLPMLIVRSTRNIR